MEGFLDPAVFEYSLLTILFISEIWPKRSETTHMIRQPSCVYDNFSIIEHVGLLQSEDRAYESIQDVNRPTPKHIIWKCINIAAAFLLVLPGTVLLAMRVYNKYDVSIRIASDYCNSIETTVCVVSDRLGQISEINRIVSKEYSKIAGSRKPSIAVNTLRVDEFVLHGQGKVAFPVIFKVKSLKYRMSCAYAITMTEIFVKNKINRP
jgi:hypothetical protein